MFPMFSKKFPSMIKDRIGKKFVVPVRVSQRWLTLCALNQMLCFESNRKLWEEDAAFPFKGLRGVKAHPSSLSK